MAESLSPAQSAFKVQSHVERKEPGPLPGEETPPATTAFLSSPWSPAAIRPPRPTGDTFVAQTQVTGRMFQALPGPCMKLPHCRFPGKVVQSNQLLSGDCKGRGQKPAASPLCHQATCACVWCMCVHNSPVIMAVWAGVRERVIFVLALTPPTPRSTHFF